VNTNTGETTHTPTSATNRHGSAVVTLEGDRTIVITRAFDAPAALVFRACTIPELVKRWWGFEDSEWVVCDIDLSVGGRWRYVTRETRGDVTFEVGFHGEYREIDAPGRLVSTEVFEGIPGGGPDSDVGAAVNTVTLDERDGVTTMTVRVVHAEPEHRTMHIESGMEGGMQISYDRMEDLVGTLD
jgi:uncharacterized protein YndB with AHSA1/START domain